MNIRESKTLAKFCMKAKVPFLLVGHSGVGKTAIVRELSESIFPNHKFITIMASQQEVGDFIGLPNFNKINGEEITAWARPEWMPFEPCVLFLDELNNARTDVESAMLQLVYEKRIHSHKLHEDSVIIAAINPATEEYTTANTMSSALTKRFIIIPFQPEEDEFLNWAQNSNRISKNFINFMKHDKAVIGLDKKLEIAIEREPCPRLWEYASKVHNEIQKDLTVNQQEVIKNLNTCTFGVKIAAKYEKWLIENDNAVGFTDLISNFSHSIEKIQKYQMNMENDKLSFFIDSLLEGTLKLREEIKEKVDFFNDLALSSTRNVNDETLENKIKQEILEKCETLDSDLKDKLDKVIYVLKLFKDDDLYQFTKKIFYSPMMDTQDRDIQANLNSHFFLKHYLFGKYREEHNLFNRTKTAAKRIK